MYLLDRELRRRIVPGQRQMHDAARQSHVDPTLGSSRERGQQPVEHLRLRRRAPRSKWICSERMPGVRSSNPGERAARAAARAAPAPGSAAPGRAPARRIRPAGCFRPARRTHDRGVRRRRPAASSRIEGLPARDASRLRRRAGSARCRPAAAGPIFHSSSHRRWSPDRRIRRGSGRRARGSPACRR